MNIIKSFLKTYSKKWYFWVGVFFLILIAIPSTEPQATIPKKESIAESNTSPSVHTSTTTATFKTEEKKVIEPSSQTAQATKPVQRSVNQNEYVYYNVTDVVDGDTVKVNINGTIETLRLIGLDTPETVDPRKEVQCFGKEASNKGKELLNGKKVRLEKDPTQGDKDKYGRTLAYIYTESGIFYNKYMIEQGYAHEYTYNSAYKYQAEFKQAQKNAEANKVGLWSPSTCNGVTTSAPKTTQTSPAVTQSSGKFYTSSIGSKYYPESCSAWQDLSKTNLRTFNSLDELLAVYPNRTIADSCK